MELISRHNTISQLNQLLLLCDEGKHKSTKNELIILLVKHINVKEIIKGNFDELKLLCSHNYIVKYKLNKPDILYNTIDNCNVSYNNTEQRCIPFLEKCFPDKVEKLVNTIKDTNVRSTIMCIATYRYGCRLICPENYVNEILSCKKEWIIIHLAITIHSIHGHSNLLLFNTKSKEIERFEPHGKLNVENIFPHVKTLMDVEINEALYYKFLIDFPDYKYVRNLDYLPKIGPQLVHKNLYGDDIEEVRKGLCFAWTILYGYLRVLYSEGNEKRRDIVEYLMYVSQNKEDIGKFITYVFNIC
jgi:hypothetical protein